MTEEAANARVELWTDDVFEFAGLAMRFVVVDAEGVFEKAFGETMAADDVAGTAAPTIGELDFAVIKDVFHARERADRVDAAGRADVLDIGAIPFLAANPNLFE